MHLEDEFNKVKALVETRRFTEKNFEFELNKYCEQVVNGEFLVSNIPDTQKFIETLVRSALANINYIKEFEAIMDNYDCQDLRDLKNLLQEAMPYLWHNEDY